MCQVIYYILFYLDAYECIKEKLEVLSELT